MRHLKWIGLAAAAVLGVAAWWLLAAGNAAENRASAPAARSVPVETATAARKPVPIEIGTIGRTQPVASVAVKPRVEGVVQTVHVEDGQEVKAGDLLFTLDDRALQAAVRQAEAGLARDRATLERARREVERQMPLLAKDYVPRATMDQLKTAAAAAEATVRADEAALEAARVELSYATIRAPIDGRLGTINYKIGNQVRPGDTTPLATLNQIAPIYVALSVPQANYAAIQRAMQAGPVPVHARIPGDTGPAIEGAVAYIENAIDPASNTLSLKARFANAERRLWPGQFVDVEVVLAVERDAVTVPAEAVQAGQNGPFLFVVKEAQGGRRAEARDVQVDRRIDGEAVISRGLEAGETVVVNGQLRLENGTAVTVKQEGKQAPAGQQPAGAPS